MCKRLAIKIRYWWFYPAWKMDRPKARFIYRFVISPLDLIEDKAHKLRRHMEYEYAYANDPDLRASHARFKTAMRMKYLLKRDGYQATAYDITNNNGKKQTFDAVLYAFLIATQRR